MYCDQPSLLTRDPGGGVNEEIPHRWAKQPHRNIIGDERSFQPSLPINSLYQSILIELHRVVPKRTTVVHICMVGTFSRVSGNSTTHAFKLFGA